MADKCAFIILSFNSAEYLARCLESVMGLQAVAPYIYIADNGSSDSSPEIIKQFEERYSERFIVQRNPNNLGTTIPRNSLLRACNDSGEDYRYICVLDSDTVVNDPAIYLLKSALDNDLTIAIAAPRMFNVDNEEQMSVKRFPRFKTKLMKAMPFGNMEQRGKDAESYPFFPASSVIPATEELPPISDDVNIYGADYAISACWFMRADMTERYGYLDEKIFYAPEDVDYCATIRTKGGNIALISGASIYHLTQRISKRKLISRMNFLHIKGLLYYSRKHRKFLKSRG